MLPLPPVKKIQWHPHNPCPCGSGRPFQNCCLQADGEIRKRLPPVLPPPPQTNHAQPGCYLSFTRDCSRQLSDEHYLSKSVLKALGSKVRVAGMPWLAKGESREIGISSLTARILCSRHNTAMSPLDDEAGHFFQAIRQSFDNLSRKSLSTKSHWYLFSGEAIELWVLKTLWGLVQSRNASIDGKPLVETHVLDADVLKHALQIGIWPDRGGLYIRAKVDRFSPLDEVSFQTINEDTINKVYGCILRLRGLEFKLILDGKVLLWAEADAPHTHHPSELIFQNRRRQHVIKLTWMPGTAGGLILVASAKG